MTYYVVKDTTGGERNRLVIAPNPAQAIRHVSKRYTAAPARTSEVADMILAGILPESVDAIGTTDPQE